MDLLFYDYFIAEDPATASGTDMPPGTAADIPGDQFHIPDWPGFKVDLYCFQPVGIIWPQRIAGLLEQFGEDGLRAIEDLFIVNLAVYMTVGSR